MEKTTIKVSTFLNPSGFVEQHYLGDQDGDSVSEGVKEVDDLVDRLRSEGKPALVLVDLTEVTSTNFDSHTVAVRGMKEVPCDLLAVYGPLSLQVLINTLSMVAGKGDIVHAFGTRIEALRWLRRNDE